MRIFLRLALLLVLLAGGSFVLTRGSSDPASDIVQAQIAGAHFSYPVEFSRDESTAVGGFTDRLAFIAMFPDFSPPSKAGSTNQTGAPNRRRVKLFITVSAKDDGLDPADRPSRLYARFLQADAEAGPGGLVLRHFENGSPYDLEELYLAPPDGRDFFARCPKSQPAQDGGAEACLFIFRNGGFDVELRFPPSLLDHWEALNEGARSFFSKIRGKSD